MNELELIAVAVWSFVVAIAGGLVGGVASVPGALIGARLTGHLSDRALVQAIGAVLLVAGTAAAIQALA